MTVRAKLIPVAVACGMAGTLAAQESEAPDLGLLEFLGSWEEGDDEWLIYDGLDQDAYEIDVVDNVFEAEDADVADDADGTEDTVESGESNDVDGTDEVATADAD